MDHRLGADGYRVEGNRAVNRTAVAVVSVIVLAAAGGVLRALQTAESPFPHEAHERLFPVCTGCHLGVETGIAEELYPPPDGCVQCHDGTREEPVEWSPPGPRASNLRFFHPDHRDLVELAGSEATCATCHVPGDPPTSRMSVEPARGEFCLSCHVADAHLEVALGAVCSDCHVPLTEARRLTVEQVASFPWPASHDEPDFLSRHTPGTELEVFSCAVCHGRETCERCHLNADQLPAVVALERDERVAMLETGRLPEYPLPANHREPSWSWAHGPTTLANPASCANCHTQPLCVQCHVEGRGRALALEFLPRPTPDRPRGVVSDPSAPVHPPGFDTQHGAWAATGALQCAACHTQQSCADCHDGPGSRAFHPPNFLERHAADVFAARADCQSCHSTETFCRDCHVGAGVAAGGGLNVAFHTSQPLWLITHGQAARMGLESCAACHAQTDCLACHSAVRGWGVSPHGPGFDADRVAARNRQTCQWCHASDPLGGR
jgi:hypothetical protein